MHFINKLPQQNTNIGFDDTCEIDTQTVNFGLFQERWALIFKQPKIDLRPKDYSQMFTDRMCRCNVHATIKLPS